MDKKRTIPKYTLPLMVAYALYFIMTSAGILANDFLWHAKVGEWILQNKQVPTYGIYSWVAKEYGLYWTSHEWLGEVILYLTDKFGGDIGIYMLCTVFGMMTIFLLIKMNEKNLSKNIVFTAVFVVTLPVIVDIFTIPRPQIFSSLFFFLTLAILYKYAEKETKWIYAIPVIALLWGNIHGGMATLCYISLFIFLIATFCDFKIGRIECKAIERRAWYKLLLVTLISIIAICLNPNGFKTISFVFSHMGDAKVMAVVTEWASPDLKNLNSLICALPIGFCCISMIGTKKNIRAYDLLMFVAMAFLFLRSARFAYYYTVSMAFYYFYYMPEFASESKVVKSLKDCYKPLTIMLGIMVTALFVFFFDSATHMTDRILSEEAIEKVTEISAERPYNFYDLGGELIYYGFDVFMDGRADMYQGEVFDDFYTLSISANDKTNTEKIINKYNFDAFYCIPVEPLNMYLEMSGDYEEVYKDDSIRIWLPIEKSE